MAYPGAGCAGTGSVSCTCAIVTRTAGLMMFSTGLIGEMMMRTYFESQDRRIYAVREILTQKRRGLASGTR